MSLLNSINKRFRVKRDRLSANLNKDQEPALGEPIQTYCFFIGHTGSGQSLISALLDAHPYALIAHEQNSLQYIQEGFSREQLYTLLVRNSRKKGRYQSNHAYAVPNQYQGSWETLKVIGDESGSKAAGWLYQKPHLLTGLRKTLGEKLCVIHISRNPFDNIATMVYRQARGDTAKMTESLIQKAKAKYLTEAHQVEAIRQQLGNGEFYPVGIEPFLNDPDSHLKQLMDFLGLTAFPAYMEACKSHLLPDQRQVRWTIQWPAYMIDEIHAATENLSCLAGYSFTT